MEPRVPTAVGRAKRRRGINLHGWEAQVSSRFTAPAGAAPVTPNGSGPSPPCCRTPSQSVRPANQRVGPISVFSPVAPGALLTREANPRPAALGRRPLPRLPGPLAARRASCAKAPGRRRPWRRRVRARPWRAPWRPGWRAAGAALTRRRRRRCPDGGTSLSPAGRLGCVRRRRRRPRGMERVPSRVR